MTQKNSLLQNTSINDYKRVFIQRNYSQGYDIVFETDFPSDLENKIDNKTWTSFINNLNKIYLSGTKISSHSITEGLLNFLTCYITRLCLKTVWEKRLEEVENYIAEINDTSFINHGLLVLNPIEKGLRVLEIVLLNEPIHKIQSSKVVPNVEVSSLQPR